MNQGRSGREPAWLIDLTEQISRSINAIESMVERVGTIRNDNSYLRAVTANLREALEVERLDSGRKLIAQGLSVSDEKRRTAEAERNADTLAGMLFDLERQITGRGARDASRAAAPARGIRDAAGTAGENGNRVESIDRIRRFG